MWLYLSQFYFSLNCLPLVYFNPWKLEVFCQCTRPQLDEARPDSYINHWCSANRWYKIKQRPPMLRGRSGSIKSYLRCTTVQSPPTRAPTLFQSIGLQATQESPIRHLQHSDSFHTFMKLLDGVFFSCKLLWNVWLFQEKPYKHFKAGNFKSSRCHRVLFYVSALRWKKEDAAACQEGPPFMLHGCKKELWRWPQGPLFCRGGSDKHMHSVRDAPSHVKTRQ